MDEQTIFYSWQSDTPAELNRSFIEGALDAAIKRIKSDATLEPAIRETEVILDKDTHGVPGSPPITQTILAKIERCAVFVADLTFVGQSLSGLSSRQRFFSNPNVLIEYGYAWGCHGHDRMVSVLNTAFGESQTDNLPFDLRHLRWPITYHLADDTDTDRKEAAFEALVISLSEAIRLILSSSFAERSRSMANDFTPHPPANNPSAFFDDTADLVPSLPFRKVEPFKVPSEGRAYLRLYPVKAVPGFTTELDAKTTVSKGMLQPMGADLTGWDYVRNVFGAIAVEGPVDGAVYRLTQLFLTRELWGVDAFAVNASRCREFVEGKIGGFIASTYVERVFTETLLNYLRFAQKFLELPLPLQIEAGLTGVNNYPIAVQSGMSGRALQDVIRWTGTIPSYEVPCEGVLRPFFDYMWAKFGVRRPDR